MAPEHARGEPVDRRADLFAVGVVLYELLAGERFWGAMPVASIWQSVGVGNHVPGRLDRLDDDVRAIVVKAVAARPADRFATAGQMRQALVKAQIVRGVVAGSAEVRDFMDRLFPGEALADRKERAALQKLAPPSGPVVNLRESTRIAAAPSRSVSSSLPLPSPALVATVAEVERPTFTGDDAPTFNDRKNDDDVATDSVRTETAFERPSLVPPPSSSSSPSTPRPVPMLAPLSPPTSPSAPGAPSLAATAVMTRAAADAPSSPSAPSSRRRWPVVVALVVAAVVIVAAVGFGLQRRARAVPVTTSTSTPLSTTSTTSTPPVSPVVAMPTPTSTGVPAPPPPVAAPLAVPTKVACPRCRRPRSRRRNR